MPSRCSLAVIVAVAVMALVAGPAAGHSHRLARERVPTTVGTQRVGIDIHGDVLSRGTDRSLRRATLRRALASTADNTTALAARSLASTWCGTARSTDDTVNDATLQGAAYKVVYAYPADQPNRLEASGYAYGSLIQGDIAAIADAIAAAAGGAKTLRVDVGTKCGPQYVDIATVRLPESRATYAAQDVITRMNSVTDAVRSAIGPLTGVRNFLVYADSLRTNGVTGIGEMYGDDRASATNAANSGDLDAVVWGDGTASFSSLGNRRTTALHEISHNLGAVQDSAPRTSGAGHCIDGYDVMCYADGGPKAGSYTTGACAWDGSGIRSYDCGSDDYFATSPAAGSYLGTHWNVFSSTFLCAPDACSTAPGATDDPPAPEPAPSPAPAPNHPPTATFTVGGPAVEGGAVTLDASPSSDPDGPIVAYAWDVDADGVTDSLATALSVVFNEPGPNEVRLTVTDAVGASASAVQTVDVKPAAEGDEDSPATDPAAVTQSRARSSARAVGAALRRVGLRRLSRQRALTVELRGVGTDRVEIALSAQGRSLTKATARSAVFGRPRVRLSLSRRVRARLGRRRRVPMRVLATSTDAAGRARTARTTVTVRR